MQHPTSSLKVIYMGSPDFAIPALQKLHEMPQIDVLAVASNPDKRRGRGAASSPTPVKACAMELGLSTFDVTSTQDVHFHEWLISQKPDLLVVVAFRILPKEVLAIPRIGSINIHASLLPKYRGAAPIHHAVMNGESQTGLSSFFLNEQMDAGKIIHQVETHIGPNESTGEVYARLMNMSAAFMEESIHKILNKDADFIEQDHSQACPAPKIFDEHCRIDWNLSVLEIHNQIRGLSPFPAAYCLDTEGKRYKIFKTHLLQGAEMMPFSNTQEGKLVRVGNEVAVKCKDGLLAIDEIRPEGKKAISGTDLWNARNDLKLI